MNVCHSQGCSVGRNHFEKDETMLKMNNDVIAAVQSLIHVQTKTFFETGIKKLPER
jgi:hypothetical protein